MIRYNSPQTNIKSKNDSSAPYLPAEFNSQRLIADSARIRKQQQK
jgi:hypothetical protein